MSIKQKLIVIKTADTTLSYSEMGDIVCNCENSITISLPTPNSGLWYRISNVGAGVVNVYYTSNMTTLKQTEQCLCLANTSKDWFFSKGGGNMTKAELEEVLTGEISSHKHDTLYAPIEQMHDYILDGNPIDDNGFTINLDGGTA